MYSTDGSDAIYFHGDVPEQWGNEVAHTKGIGTIYYVEGKNGWTSPTWKALDGMVYNTATWEP